jgi:ElaB/YqjD/DUF883 family membrane-anchored ribosome-binding protein
MKNQKDTTHTPKELLVELQALVAEAQALTTDAVSEKSGEIMENLRARFSAAQEQFADVYDGAKRRVVAGAKCTDAAIRENPYQAVAIAAGVGLLVGILVGRRTK